MNGPSIPNTYGDIQLLPVLIWMKYQRVHNVLAPFTFDRTVERSARFKWTARDARFSNCNPFAFHPNSPPRHQFSWTSDPFTQWPQHQPFTRAWFIPIQPSILRTMLGSRKILRLAVMTLTPTVTLETAPLIEPPAWDPPSIGY